MAKYSLAFKLRVIRYRDRYQLGFKATAKHFEIDDGLVRKWHGAYELHGEEGLERRYRHYSPDFKVGVVQRMASEGWSARQACAKFNIPGPSTIAQWQLAFAEGGAAALEPKRRGRVPKMAKHTSHTPPLHQRPKAPKNMTTDELHERLAYLEAENAYLKKLKALAQEKQSAEKKKRG